MDYEPKRISIRELFKQDNVLSVPRYQRSYAWKTGNIDDFYEDFVKTSETNMSFFGTLVFDASQATEYQVIDGQQRIMTLTIFYAVLRDILNEDISTQSAYKLAASIDDTYIRADDELSVDETSIFRVKPAKDVDDFFLQFIQLGGTERRKSSRPSTQSQKNIKIVYDYLRKLISADKAAGDKLSAEQKVTIIKNVANKLGKVSVIKIEIYNNEIAYSIFESHNAKGQDLLISDLIKNYYYSKLTGPEDKRELKIDQWDNIVDRLRNQAGVKIDTFLHYYAQSFDGRFLKSQLYKRVKNEINDDVNRFTKNFIEQSNLFIAIKDAAITDVTDSFRVNNSLERISQFNVDQIYIFLLSLFRNKEKLHPKFIKKIVFDIEKHTFIYNVIAKRPANVMEKVYGTYSQKIQKDLEQKTGDKLLAASGQFYSAFQKALVNTLPSYDEFSAAFVELDYSSPKQKRLMKNYIFPTIEESLTNNGITFGADISLDHIVAKNGKHGVSLDFINKIGNLVPIDAKSNSKLGNKPLEQKLDVYTSYRNKNIDLLLDFVKQSGIEFGDEQIEKRGKEIAKLAYHDIWKFN